jgi:hypothetical protein
MGLLADVSRRLYWTLVQYAAADKRHRRNEKWKERETDAQLIRNKRPLPLAYSSPLGDFAVFDELFPIVPIEEQHGTGSRHHFVTNALVEK